MRIKTSFVFLFFLIFAFISCNKKHRLEPEKAEENKKDQDTVILKRSWLEEIVLEKKLLYNEHTLEDKYPYKDTVRVFQWEKIKRFLAIVDSIQEVPATWGILQNRQNINGEAPLVRQYGRDEYKRIVDTFNIERFQGIPLYSLIDSTVPERYGLDGSLVKVSKDTTSFTKAQLVFFKGNWLIPTNYIKFINDTVVFRKVMVVDRVNQNIVTLEKVDKKWLIRSMNPVTTGLHKPPIMQETPLGIFVIQEKKAKMVYLTDDSKDVGGFAPFASRFSNGGYLHGIPVNEPHTATIEFSPSLGTTPRSHMCVRNATSHSKFIYDWAPVESSLVYVFD